MGQVIELPTRRQTAPTPKMGKSGRRAGARTRKREAVSTSHRAR